jgi:hypothetical protein
VCEEGEGECMCKMMCTQRSMTDAFIDCGVTLNYATPVQ